MEKLCSGCKLVMSLTFFNKKGKTKTGDIKYQPYCKDCNKTHSKRYYQNNKESHKKVVKTAKTIQSARNKKYILEYLSRHPCVDCGNSDIRVLEFDHVRGTKKDHVSSIIDRSLLTLKAEIEKCDVRCSNCHMIVTGERNNNYRHNYYLNLK